MLVLERSAGLCELNAVSWLRNVGGNPSNNTRSAASTDKHSTGWHMRMYMCWIRGLQDPSLGTYSTARAPVDSVVNDGQVTARAAPSAEEPACKPGQGLNIEFVVESLETI